MPARVRGGREDALGHRTPRGAGVSLRPRRAQGVGLARPPSLGYGRNTVRLGAEPYARLGIHFASLGSVVHDAIFICERDVEEACALPR